MPALESMKVLDLTQYEAGPVCTQMLAWLGAQVVKIEPPRSGDPGRHTAQVAGDADALYFLSFNANKQSVTLNLRTEEGRRIFLELVARFDVVVENFTVGTMEHLGIGYDELRKANPSIIYGSLKGFGLTGPHAEFKCFDWVAQATAGIFSVTGTPQTGPIRPAAAVGDTGSGITLALGIVAAYVQKLLTGEGQRVEVAMQEAALNFMRMQLSTRTETGEPLQRRDPHAMAPSGIFPCAPGGANDYVYIMVPTSKFWDTLTIAMNRPELATDPRFSTHEQRRSHSEELWQEMACWTRQQTKFEVFELLGAIGVPCGAVYDSSDIFHDQHLRDRDMIATMHHPVRGDWEFPAPPVRMERSHVDFDRAPLLGEHTDDLLSTVLGLDANGLELLREKGIT
jgi:formyl-CoA transferase